METDGTSGQAAVRGAEAGSEVTGLKDSTEVNVEVKGLISGCEVKIAFTSKEAELKEKLLSIIKRLQEIGIEPISLPRDTEFVPRGASEGEEATDPYNVLAREADVPSFQLKELFGIKGNTIQLYKANKYKISDAIAVLLFANEKALENTFTPYDSLAALLDSNHIKTPMPLSTVCFNLIRDGTIDKKAYEDSKRIVLTPAGEQKAIKALKNPEEIKAKPAAPKKKEKKPSKRPARK